ncbi:MAG: metallophosphoesterase [Chloroflexota bacterium]|nr:metallophosphoesterase [Chloroflexota bacterium]
MRTLSPTRIILIILILFNITACTLPKTDSPAVLHTENALRTRSPAETENAPIIPPSPSPTLLPSGTISPSSTPAPDPASTTASTPAEDPLLSVRIAVIGDYGLAGKAEGDVANLIKSWQPDYILTTGDNNYPDGAWGTIDENIGQYYHEFIAPYVGKYGEGADQNRFYPTLGNHDWTTDSAQPYLDYFTLPGNERYYEVELGPVHVFALNSDWREPDGVGRSSIQAQWLHEKLSSSKAPWKLVVYHATAYSSGHQGSTDWMRWPFQEWGATAALAGHDHLYERLEINGFPYFTNGLGGGAIYNIKDPIPGSQVRYNGDYGAMLILADENKITFQFINRSGKVIDTFQIVN